MFTSENTRSTHADECGSTSNAHISRQSIGNLISTHQCHPSLASMLARKRQVACRKARSTRLVNTKGFAIHRPVCPDQLLERVEGTWTQISRGKSWNDYLTKPLSDQDRKSWTGRYPLRSQTAYESGHTVPSEIQRSPLFRK